jgi:hypothetical protein
MDGCIWVESAPNVGSDFHFILKLLTYDEEGSIALSQFLNLTLSLTLNLILNLNLTLILILSISETQFIP